MILGLGDVGSLLVAAQAADALRQQVRQLPSEPSEIFAIVFLIPLLLLLFWRSGLYAEEQLLYGTQEYIGGLRACTLGALMIVGFEFLIGDSTLVPRTWLIFFWLFSCLIVCVWRFVGRRLIRILRSKGGRAVRLLIVGASDQGVAIAEQLDAPKRHGTEVVGFLDDYLPAGTAVLRGHPTDEKTLRVLGDPGSLQDVARAQSVAEVVVVPPALSWESLNTIIGEATKGHVGFRLRLAPGMYDIASAGLRSASRAGVPLVEINTTYIMGIDRAIKGFLDRAIAATAMLVCAPVLSGMALYAKLAGEEPILERRLVRGPKGKPVSVSFFGPWAGSHRLLRGLPTLATVLRGHLSLVGPRPEPVSNGEITARSSPMIKPGLTGLWRIAPASTARSAWNSDLWYARNYSVWEDLRILYQTMWRLFEEQRQSGGLGHWLPDMFPSAQPEDALPLVGLGR